MDRSKIVDDTIQVISINKDGKFFEKGTQNSNHNIL